MFRRLIMLLLAVLGPLSAADLQVVTQFTREGELPMARLLYVPAVGKFFGTTSTGGSHDCGTIFSITPDGTRTTLASLSGTVGPAKGDAPDAGLVLGSDGELYGVTSAGGTADLGTIFRVSTTGAVTTLIEFTGATGAAKGAVPNELVLAADGSFYGTTQAGGVNEHGTVFRLNLPPAPSLPSITTLVELTGPIAGGPGIPRGSAPVGALVANGTNLYGVTAFGGTADFGLVFRVTTAGTWTTLAQFTGTAGTIRGAYPAAGLVLHSNGSLYGTTEYGGPDDLGTVFRVSAGNVFTHLHAFNDLDGSGPAGALVMGADQLLYGTTSAGGAEGYGTIFRISPASPATFSTLHSFTGQTGVLPGDASRAGFTLGPGGIWYGTTTAGGPGNYGVIFKLTPQLAASTIASLGNAESWFPGGGVTFAAPGELLVPLTEGGPDGGGTLARVVGGVPSTEASFGALLGTPPIGNLVQVGADFYGVTRSGGSSNRGTIFRYTPGVGVTTLANLTASLGASPEGPLTLGPDGRLYVVAQEGGAFNRGAILRFEINGTVSNLVSFTGTGGALPGRRPRGPLLLTEEGTLYGVTELGGINDRGTIFRIPSSGAAENIYQFPATGAGRPRAGLSHVGNGILLGTTSASGTSAAGSIFQITTAGVYSSVVDFVGSNGSQPNCRLLRSLDGTFYGTTYGGGAQGIGTFFALKPGTGLQTLIHFTGINGTSPGEGPVGELSFGPDGMIYGVTEAGGPKGGGMIYRITGFGPHVATELPTFALSVPSLRGRMQTGGQAINAHFEFGFDPTLPFPNTVPAASSIEENGTTIFFLPLSNVSVGQTVYYRAVATGPGSTSIGNVRSFTVPSPYAGWKLTELEEGSSGDLDDPDFDGLANLVEYALLLNPRSPNPGPQPALHGENPGEARLTLTLQRDPARNDVTISVQASSTITGSWTTIATSSNGAPFTGVATIVGDNPGNGVRSVEIRDPNPIQASTQRFLRVLVSH